MEKKILFCASTFQHIQNFHLPYVRAFQDRGYRVWAAAAGGGRAAEADETVDLPLCKRFFSPRNLAAVFRLRALLKKERFQLVSTHTTLANAAVRLAVLLLKPKDRPKVAATCHGYLFHESDFKKWVYLLPEKICAGVTDVLMVMNREDWEIARRRRLYRGKLVMIPGMGIPAGRFQPVSPDARAAGRAGLGLAPNAFLYVYAAEFSKRKDQSSLIRAFAKVCPGLPKARLLLAGEGAMLEECKVLAESLAPGRVTFLGYVDGMERLYPCCDVAVASSRIEGLPFNVLEALLCGLPVIARDTKGHRDLIVNGENGILYRDGRDLERALIALYEDEALRDRFSQKAVGSAGPYLLERAFPAIMGVYHDLERTM